MSIETDMQKQEYSSFMPMPQQTPALMSLPQEVIDLILDPFKVIERIRRDLKGEVLVKRKFKDENGQEYEAWVYEEIGLRVMNDLGISFVTSILNKYVNRNTILSNLDEDEIYKIILQLDLNLNAIFYERGDEFELDPNMKSIVKDSITDMCFMALKQSQNKALLEALTKAYTVRELKGYPAEKRGGISSIPSALMSPFK